MRITFFSGLLLPSFIFSLKSFQKGDMKMEINHSQIDSFIKTLYHDDFQSNMFLCHSKNGQMKSQRFSLREYEDSLKAMITIDSDWYMLKNREYKNSYYRIVFPILNIEPNKL